MTLWLLFLLMTAIAILAVLWPLARRQPSASGSDLAVYRDQLDEIRRDRAAGLIGESEAEAAEVEVSRRLLAAADAQDAPAASAPASATWRRTVAVAALVLLPLGATGLYLSLGAPSLPDQPLAARNPQNQSVENLVAQIEAHLQRNPDDGRGWEVLAPVYLRLGRFDDAIKANRNALRLGGETADRQANLGEALVAAENGVVTVEAKAAFQRAVALDAQNVRGRFFLGVAAEQDGRRDEAAQIWRAMLTTAAPDEPWTSYVRAELERIEGRGPTEDQIAGANDLTPDQRLVMIRGMVARLSERLRHDGSDVEGWVRLVRSYMVLGERGKALAAVADARRALTGEPAKLRQIDELAKGLGLEG